MRIEILERSGSRLRFVVEGAPLAFVNSVRRACFTDVPVMAVDYVEIIDNNTVLYDEILAHRLALIPLRSKEALAKYKWPDEFKRECLDAEGKPRFDQDGCFAVLRLEAEVEPRPDAPPRMVYSGDIVSDDPDVKPVYDNIPIVLVAPGQRLSIVAYARLGLGREHAKWFPVSIAAHRYTPVLEFNPKHEKAGECIECIEEFEPELAAKLRELKEPTRMEILEDVRSNTLLWCIRKRCGGAASLTFREDKLIVTIESVGQLPPEDIVVLAARALKRKAEQLLKELEGLKSETG